MEKARRLRGLQGILESHPLSKKYSAVEVVKIARRKIPWHILRGMGITERDFEKVKSLHFKP